jgi:hypothetical protein
LPAGRWLVTPSPLILHALILHTLILHTLILGTLNFRLLSLPRPRTPLNPTCGRTLPRTNREPLPTGKCFDRIGALPRPPFLGRLWQAVPRALVVPVKAE